MTELDPKIGPFSGNVQKLGRILVRRLRARYVEGHESRSIPTRSCNGSCHRVFCVTDAFRWTHDPDSDVYPTDSGQSRKDIQFQTIQWLIDHDYLHDELGFVGGEWKGLLLTERGLTALNSVPDALTGKESLGKRLSVAVGKGSLEAIKQLLPAVIQQAFLGG